MSSGQDSVMKLPRKLWEHPDPKSTDMYKFMQEVNKKHGLNLQTYWDLYQFSINNKSQFWAHVLDFCCLIYDGSYERVVDESKPISSVPKWFEGLNLNFAENLLFSRSRSDPSYHNGTTGKEDGKIAVTEVREGITEIREITWAELRRSAGKMASAMKARGVKKGDRIVIIAANSLETFQVYLATTWLGAIFSSSSTDMGVNGILQRTTQINPKFIFMDDASLYNGKKWDLREKMAAIVKGMEQCDEFAGMVSIKRWAKPLDVSHIPRTETFDNFLGFATSTVPEFVRIGWNEPFLLAFSSGTTGIPKAIVHGVGGVLINYYKEGRLHHELSSKDVTLQYTTTGWIMYLANVAQLLFGTRGVFYDGSPFHPDLKVWIKLMGDQKVTRLGISPRWMQEIAKNSISPREVADLSSLQAVTSTGMVLSDQLFEWFYDKGFPKHVHLANISGGTDIAGCFGIENPLTPVYVGGAQGPCLGTPIAIYDSLLPNGPGKPVPDGTPGELVATGSFPNIPVLLWNDKTPVATPGSKYHSSYFARFDDVWAHGDFCVIHPVTKNITFLGRADGVLNPSGVRFGSAEIYSVIERNFSHVVADSICVGQRRPTDEDESVMLFLLMKPGEKFHRGLVHDVKQAIARELTKRHVPKYVFETPEIPTTVNLKKVELPVKQIVSGQRIKPSGTLANPESLEYYYQFANVEDLIIKEKL